MSSSEGEARGSGDGNEHRMVQEMRNRTEWEGRCQKMSCSMWSWRVKSQPICRVGSRREGGRSGRAVSRAQRRREEARELS